MNWKLKASIQSIIAKLPSDLSYKIYYFIQRRFGALRTLNPIVRLACGVTILDCIREQSRVIESKTFLEVGTGWRVNLPIALWLGGASKIITIDLNPYLKTELILGDLAYIRNNQQEVKKLFGDYAKEPIFLARLDKLINTETTLDQLFDMVNVEYLAPADATCLDLPSQSVDYHVSNTVFEHIQPDVLGNILLEGKRLLKDNGLFIHLIDLSDHFSHSDASICAINFLQYNESKWNRYAGNRYAYHNRLRIDDFLHMFNKMGLTILSTNARIDERSLEVLRKESPLDDRFMNRDEKTNATISAEIVAALGQHG